VLAKQGETFMTDEPFLIDDHDRYGSVKLIGWWDQAKLRGAKILVVGAGALGNEVLKNLALLGVGELHVVDFDRIESSNLTRSVLFRERDCGRPKAEVAAEALRELNPDIRVWPWVANIITEIGLGLFRHCDLIIGCLDNREARLWVNRQCWKVNRPWIDGGIQEIQGVVKVFCPPSSACYECGMTENDYRLINLRYSCPLLRQEDLLAGKVPTAPTIASMIGGLQVQEALKLLHGLPVSSGSAIVYNGLANHMYRTAYQRHDACLSHEMWPAILDLPLTVQHTAEQLAQTVGKHAGWEKSWQILLERDLVLAIECEPCTWSQDRFQPAHNVKMAEAQCPHCGQPAHPIMIHTIDSDSAWTRLPLSRLGIPAFDIIRMVTDTGELTVCLAGDRPTGVNPSHGFAEGSLDR